MENNVFVCPVCGNKDEKYIGFRNGSPYCRKCITFRGKEATSELMYPKSAYYKLDYKLSDDQIALSNKLITNYKEGINSLVHAVCGSGKTEIVLDVIKYAIQCGENVGFAIPRRDVVIEIAERFQNIFKKNKVIAVYGGHNDDIYGDLTILTTHQLYHYQYYFDLLIIDEIDAFPFKGNEILDTLFKRAIRGRYILMSATPSEEILNEFHKKGNEVLELFSRFHGHNLPMPKIVKGPTAFLLCQLIRYSKTYLRNKKQVFIFTPTIEMCEEIFMFLSNVIKDGNYVHSKRDKREEIIQNFKDGKFKYLVTTAVLERGVTIKDLQVIIYKADHPIYDSHALVQISGRVGRKKDAPEGEVIFLVNENNREIEKCCNEIERANSYL